MSCVDFRRSGASDTCVTSVASVTKDKTRTHGARMEAAKIRSEKARRFHVRLWKGMDCWRVGVFQI